jgi:hypothetical protein
VRVHSRKKLLCPDNWKNASLDDGVFRNALKRSNVDEGLFQCAAVSRRRQKRQTNTTGCKMIQEGEKRGASEIWSQA